jgi:hypothetical protein
VGKDFVTWSYLVHVLRSDAAAPAIRERLHPAVLQRIKASGSARQCTKFNLPTKKPGSKRSAP